MTAKGNRKAKAKAKAQPPAKPKAQAPAAAQAPAPVQPPAPIKALAQPQVNAQRTLVLATAALAVLGLAVSVYLTVVHYSPVPLICLGTTGCEEVNRSIYSMVAGVPVALLGALTYVAILAALWAESLKVIKREEAVLAVFGVSLAGLLYSAYLTYVELALLRAVCVWCVISALAITAIFALSVARLRAELAPEAHPAKGKHK